MSKGGAIPIVGQDARIPKPVAKAGTDEHRITIEFADDHSFDGAKFRIVGVSPEQMATAVLYLQRFALMGVANREAQIVAEAQQAQAVRESLAREQKGN